MHNRIAAALVIAPMLLTACAHKAGETSLNERERVSCERTIYRTAGGDDSKSLRCAQLLGLWD